MPPKAPSRTGRPMHSRSLHPMRSCDAHFGLSGVVFEYAVSQAVVSWVRRACSGRLSRESPQAGPRCVSYCHRDTKTHLIRASLRARTCMIRSKDGRYSTFSCGAVVALMAITRSMNTATRYLLGSSAREVMLMAMVIWCRMQPAGYLPTAREHQHRTTCMCDAQPTQQRSRSHIQM